MILTSPFEFIISKIRDEVDKDKDYYPSFRVTNFGKFHVPKNVVEHVRKNLDRRKNESV